jgi:hypothetical protein
MADADDSASAPLLDSTDSLQHKDLQGGHLTVQGDAYTYAYGPSGYAGLLHNPFVLGCAVFASIGGLTFGPYSA